MDESFNAIRNRVPIPDLPICNPRPVISRGGDETRRGREYGVRTKNDENDENEKNRGRKMELEPRNVKTELRNAKGVRRSLEARGVGIPGAPRAVSGPRFALASTGDRRG